MQHTLTAELLADVARLPTRHRRSVMRELARVEFERCAEDLLYWLDESRHPGVPYVYTHDKRQMYVCNVCIKGDPARREWTYGQHQLQHHCEFHHNDLKLQSEAEILGAFTPLDWKRPFTLKSYMLPIFKVLQQEQLVAIEKSRDMIATWFVTAYVTWDALFHDGRQNICQSKTAPFTLELTRERCHFMWRNQPAWLKNLHKVEWTVGNLKSGVIRVPTLESEILGFPQGPDQIRQYHPNIIFMDEAAFQEKCGDAVAAAKPAIQAGGQIILLSSANPSYFQLCVEDRSDSE